MSLILKVTRDQFLVCNDKRYPCDVGRSGIGDKSQEGDGVTPNGDFLLREVLYRPDRLPMPPQTRLPLSPITPDDGWNDDPSSDRYNSRIILPTVESHEILWREDGLYDVAVVLGYNDDPVVSGRGSAIFLHVAKGDYEPTEGCVALKIEHLLQVLIQCDETTVIRIG